MRLLLALAIALASIGIAVGPPRVRSVFQEETVSGVGEQHLLAPGRGARVDRAQAPDSDQRAPDPVAAFRQPRTLLPPGRPCSTIVLAEARLVGSAASGQPRVSRGPPALS